MIPSHWYPHRWRRAPKGYKSQQGDGDLPIFETYEINRPCGLYICTRCGDEAHIYLKLGILSLHFVNKHGVQRKKFFKRRRYVTNNWTYDCNEVILKKVYNS